jgi:phenylalanyl-tRNA synthetase alpha chain
MQEKLAAIVEQALKEIASAPDTKALYEVKVRFMGKQGELSNVMKDMGQLPPAERPAFGKVVNENKARIEKTYQDREAELKNKELEAKIQGERLDLTLPGPHRPAGTIHPITAVFREIVAILSRIGYSVRLGPQIESDWYNFEALNIPKDHPARDLQDTFYIDDTHVLRTHTSPIQIHAMLKEKPPLRILAPGSVFRSDSDISHSPNFHQIEGMLIDKKVSMADLKGTIAYFASELFKGAIEIRFRPSFFPFTEPSAEFDCSCPICGAKGCRMCKGTGWIEIGGCGLINPKVLEAAKIDPEEWQGFAFGFGIERMAIIRYGIEHIGLFSENNVRFLRQFPS